MIALQLIAFDWNINIINLLLAPTKHENWTLYFGDYLLNHISDAYVNNFILITNKSKPTHTQTVHKNQ